MKVRKIFEAKKSLDKLCASEQLEQKYKLRLMPIVRLLQDVHKNQAALIQKYGLPTDTMIPEDKKEAFQKYLNEFNGVLDEPSIKFEFELIPFKDTKDVSLNAYDLVALQGVFITDPEGENGQECT